MSASSCIQSTAVAASCSGSPATDNEGRRANFDKWEKWNEPDWMVIRPNYIANAPNNEIRTFVSCQLVSSVTPSAGRVYPTTYQDGGYPVGVISLLQAFPNLTYQESGSLITLPRNVNILNTFPNLLFAYQTDNITGPSEKILINLALLRNYQLDIVNFKIGFFYINSNRAISEVPLHVTYYQGGFPTVVDGPTEADWVMQGSTSVVNTGEVVYKRVVIGNGTTRATADIFWNMKINFSQKTIYYDTPNG